MRHRWFLRKPLVLTGVLQNGSWAYYSSRTPRKRRDQSASRFSPPAPIRGAAAGDGVGKRQIGKRISEKSPPCWPSEPPDGDGLDTSASRFLSFPSRPNFHFAELQFLSSLRHKGAAPNAAAESSEIEQAIVGRVKSDALDIREGEVIEGSPGLAVVLGKP